MRNHDGISIPGIALALLLALGQAGAATPSGLGDAAKAGETAEAALGARQYDKALPLFEQALSVYEAAHEELLAANILIGIAQVREGKGEYDAALNTIARALAIYEKRDATSTKEYAQANQTLAKTYLSRGDLANGLPAMERSVALSSKAFGERDIETIIAHSNLATIYLESGDFSNARVHAVKALNLCEQVPNPSQPCIGVTLLQVGGVYSKSGDNTNSLLYYKRALAAMESELGPDHPSLAIGIANVAAGEGSAGNFATAIQLSKRGLALQEKNGKSSLAVANTLNNLAFLYTKTGQHENAISAIERAIAIRESIQGKWSPGLAIPLNNYAKSLDALGQAVSAQAQARRGLALALSHGLMKNQNDSLQELASLQTSAGNKGAAVFLRKQAINAVLTIAQATKLRDRDLGKTFVAEKGAGFRSLIDELIGLDRLPEAQEILALLKGDEYLHFTNQRGASTTFVSFTGHEMPWVLKFGEHQKRLVAMGAALSALQRKSAQQASEEERRRQDAAEAALAAEHLAFMAFLDQAAEAFASAGTARPATTQASLQRLDEKRALLKRHGEGSVALEYVVGGERLHIVVTGHGRQLVRHTEVSPAQLQRKIAAFRQVLQNPRRDPSPMARELYRLLVAPVARELDTMKARTLLVSLDGTLRYLPLAALYDGKRYLAQRYNLALLSEMADPAAGATPVRPLPQLAAFGLTKAVAGFKALPGVERELAGIVGNGGQAGVVSGEVHLDQAFTAASLAASFAKGYSLIHVATHFVYKAGRDDASFLLLGDGSKLTLRELQDKRFDFAGTELLTLSACDTAAAAIDANGQEVEGVASMLQQRGAKTVLATLWAVDDESTAAFMPSFYRHLQTDVSKPEALRLAQRDLMQHASMAGGAMRGAARVGVAATSRPFRAGKRARYAHPYYWAPFVMMSSWR
ncbi:CHAT domain-containing protein [Massilia glaciei]|uniref:CHAT domain-containing protein n=1 Tax=Massilia glaciei TaxID=1524097 RepID=A0A2U2HC58_9BURK|nr:CHAT domain-containing protein [Massilia glaciei]PWF40536.1 CHAT domain-containing protein [Massilia glaciei]